MGAQAIARVPPPARLRRPGTGALERAARTFPGCGRGHQPAAGELHHRGTVFSRAAAAGGAARTRPAAAVHPHAEEPPASTRRGVGRARSSSPSEGSAGWHHLNQKVLIEQAFDLGSHASEPSMVLSKEV